MSKYKKAVVEKDVENHLVKQCAAAGFLIRKVQWVGHNHAPDRLIMTKGKTIWVELKAPAKKPASGQLREHARMRIAGQNVTVVDSKDAVDKLIEELKYENE